MKRYGHGHDKFSIASRVRAFPWSCAGGGGGHPVGAGLRLLLRQGQLRRRRGGGASAPARADNSLVGVKLVNVKFFASDGAEEVVPVRGRARVRGVCVRECGCVRL